MTNKNKEDKDAASASNNDNENKEDKEHDNRVKPTKKHPKQGPSSAERNICDWIEAWEAIHQELPPSQKKQTASLARDGVNAVSLASLYKEYYNLDDKEMLNPPLRKGITGRDQIEYLPPSDHWKAMASETMLVMKRFLDMLDLIGMAPIRWNWKYEMARQLGWLEDIPSIDIQMYSMLVLITLAAATSDYMCIDGTKRLKDNNLLTPQAMAAADPEWIRMVIKSTGIDNNRANWLQQQAKNIINNHGGRVPADLTTLLGDGFPGIAQKSALLLLVGGYGMFLGVPVDTHGMLVPASIGLYVQPVGKEILDPDHVEHSLRQWISVKHYPVTNPTFGGIAQTFTQDFKNTSSHVSRMTMLRVLCEVREWIGQPLHVKMLFFILSRVLREYEKVGVEVPNWKELARKCCLIFN